VTIAVSAALIVFGLVRPGPSWERLGIVPVVFGALGTILAGLDIVKLVRPPAGRHAWWFAHMAGTMVRIGRSGWSAGTRCSSGM